MKQEEFGGGGLQGEGKVLQMLESRTGMALGLVGLQPCSQEGRRKEELVASDCMALSNVGNLHGLSRGKRVSGLGLGVDREAEVPLWVDSSPQIL